MGYRDLAGFGRRFIDYARADLVADVLYQVGALDALARAAGTRVRYVKPHGALYAAVVQHEEQAGAVVEDSVLLDGVRVGPGVHVRRCIVDEATALTGCAEPHAAAQILLRQVPAVVITLGRKGCLYAARGAEPVLFPAPEVTAVDTTGAGDTFVGTLAVALGEGRPVPEAVAWASSAAALCVQRQGASTSMPHRSEIDAA